MNSFRTWSSRFYGSKPVARHRRPAPRTDNRFRSCLEILEDRLAPAAGDINATLSLGTLTLMGAVATANESLTLKPLVSLTPGGITLNNATGNILIGGVSQGAIHNFFGVHSISINLSGG